MFFKWLRSSWLYLWASESFVFGNIFLDVGRVCFPMTNLAKEVTTGSATSWRQIYRICERVGFQFSIVRDEDGSSGW